jgi:hypothetical protein
MLISNMHFQFLKRTFHRLLITGLTLYWKYHTPDESKLLYRGCLASFENRNFCIKLSKIRSRKKYRNIGIFSWYRFSFFFKYRNSLAQSALIALYCRDVGQILLDTTVGSHLKCHSCSGNSLFYLVPDITNIVIL